MQQVLPYWTYVLTIIAISSAAVLPSAAKAAQVALAGEDAPSLLQKASVPSKYSGNVKESEEEGGPEPFLVSLRRESVPVKRHGRIASFKTSYSGAIHVGSPPQEFRVVFDTGSGHVILPASDCQSEACLVHRRYDPEASSTAHLVNVDGSAVQPGDGCDQVDIGFGTGEITGEFVNETICLGATPDLADEDDGGAKYDEDLEPGCVTLRVVMAVEMSTQPFRSFAFDGIMGMGLGSLALNPYFSFFGMLQNQQPATAGSSMFGVFLTEGEDDEESEIAFGGINQKRLMGPVKWTPVAMSHLGYWQVEIHAVYVDGTKLNLCSDGGCRGVVDTGTSHIGVPSPFDKEVIGMLSQPAGEMLDCRLAIAPVLEIELDGLNITLNAENYMRRLPLREGLNIGSERGVYLTPNGSDDNATVTTTTTMHIDVEREDRSNISRHCIPRMMPVTMPPPLGPSLFILGEPILHRYYTVYDWEAPMIGFALANNRRNNADPSEITDRRGTLPPDVDVLLMHQKLSGSVPTGSVSMSVDEFTLTPELSESDDPSLFQSRSVKVVVVTARVAVAVRGDGARPGPDRP